MFDSDGRLWLQGRCKARIDDRHGRLYPFIIETACSENPNIERAALTSLDDKRILVLQSSRTETELLEEVKEISETYHIDQIIKHEIPLDARHNAKVDYTALTRIIKGATHGH